MQITVTNQICRRLTRHKNKIDGRSPREMKMYKPTVTAIMDDSGSVDVLRIIGDLSWDTVYQINSSTEKLAGREGVPLVIDLSGLEFIDSKGIGFLLALRFAFKDKDVSLVCVPSDIKKVLERTFVLGRFHVYKNVSDVEALSCSTLVSA
jgi:anti-anti-sigma factor